MVAAMPLSPVLTAILAWATGHPRILALALVGSHARGEARDDSDIDLLFLTVAPDHFRAAWLDEIDWPAGSRLAFTRDASYGAVWSRHVGFSGGPEIEFSFAELSWACLDPLESGTRRVASDGLQILYDPDGRLAALRAALG
jgi:hypothetical protein